MTATTGLLERPTAELARYAAELTPGALPAEVLELAGTCVTDFMACAVDGCARGPAQLMYAALVPPHTAGRCTLPGTGLHADAQTAALINGAAGHMGEVDDTHRGTMSHPGDSVIGAAWAVAEEVGASGPELLTAIVAGYEVAIRAGRAVMPTHYTLGWHPSGTINTFGAAAAAGRVLGLTPEQMTHCLGLAGAQVAGNFAHLHNRSMVKDFNSGRAAANGVLAARLAAAGFTAAENTFESGNGFLALYATDAQPQELVDGLGDRYAISEIGFKLHPGCRHLHPAREGLLAILDGGVAPESVTAVEARVFATGARLIDDPAPWEGVRHPSRSRFSLQFNLGVVLACGQAGLDRLHLDAFVEECFADEAVRERTARVTLVHDAELDETFPAKWATVVRVCTADGWSAPQRVDYPRGEPENPASRAELRDKFLRLTEPVLGGPAAADLLAQLDGVAELASVNALVWPAAAAPTVDQYERGD
jgi:2-methylcitrate dehydratase PrpD